MQQPSRSADALFNGSCWCRKDDGVRRQFRVPPKCNGNFAWVQHFIPHLAPYGMPGFILSNGARKRTTSLDVLFEKHAVSLHPSHPGPAKEGQSQQTRRPAGFRGKGRMARRDEGEYPWWIFD